MITYSLSNVRIHEGNLDFLVNNPQGDVGRWMDDRAKAHVRAAKARVGVKTGATRSSIHSRHARDARGQFVEISATTRSAYMHHQGTRPHVIRPNTGRVMRFTSQGRIVYARRVLHPGTRPNRYLTDTLFVWRV